MSDTPENICRGQGVFVMVFGPKRRVLLGQTGERLARLFLEKNGYKIKEINYRVPVGEIDVIAEHQGCLVFLEVKTRSGDGFGTPAEAVTLRKQKQIIRVAQYYASLHDCFDVPSRFDVVSIILCKGKEAKIEIIENAFEQH